MKRWEVAKGIQEGRFGAGTRFRVTYPDGDTGEAFVNEHGALRWRTGEHLISIVAYDKDVWTLIKEEEKEEDKFVTIKQSRLDYLEEREEFLNCLEACGVDNWEGYGDAYQMMGEDE